MWSQIVLSGLGLAPDGNHHMCDVIEYSNGKDTLALERQL
jgi:hypothetical protein